MKIEVPHQQTKYYSGKATSDEALPCLLWWKLNKWRSSKEETKDVSPDIIDGNHWYGYNEPEEED